MKEDMQKKIEKIKLEQKVPKSKKKITRKKVLHNILLDMAIMVYFTLLILGSNNSIKSIRIIDFNIFSIVLLATTIILFEKAYKKENGAIALYGIEIFVVGLITLFFSYIVFELKIGYKMYFLNAFITIYYIIKSICIVIIDRRKYRKEKLNDIKQTIEVEVPERRESHRKIKEENKKSEQKKKSINKKTTKTDIVKIENKEEEIKPEKIEEVTPTKKRGRPKKTDIKQDENKITALKDETPKRRGRPKKTNITQNENKETVKEVAPKKRGRPRKVVQ